jgi:KGK domain
MDSNYQPLGEDDVLHIPESASGHRESRLMNTVAPFTASLKEALNSWPYVAFAKSSEGYPVSILKTSGGGWQQGKLRVRIVVEFEPDPQPIVEEQHHDH